MKPLSQFIYAYEEGNYEMAKRIYCCDPEKALRTACESGHIDIVQWIYSEYKIDAVRNRDAFQWCCLGNKLEIAQWIYSQGNVDIHHQH